MLEEIRAAEPADAAFLADAWRAMSDEVGLAPRGFAAGWRERLIAYFSAGIADGSQRWFLVLLDGRPVATTAVFARSSVVAEVQYRRVGVLAGVFVAPECRRTGLARRLVTHALQWCRTYGCTHVTLQTSDAAEPLYRELGFEDDRGLVLNLK
jgi:GNAT superfamily N-acetyltransferase